MRLRPDTLAFDPKHFINANGFARTLTRGGEIARFSTITGNSIYAVHYTAAEELLRGMPLSSGNRPRVIIESQRTYSRIHVRDSSRNLRFSSESSAVEYIVKDTSLSS